MYTDQQKREIERVLSVFKPYIDQADYLEYLWSDKLHRYVFLFIDRARDSIEESEFVDSSAMICERIYWEMGNDVLLEHGLDGPIGTASKPARDEFLRRIQPFDVQLPEYHFLIEQLLSQPSPAE